MDLIRRTCVVVFVVLAAVPVGFGQPAEKTGLMALLFADFDIESITGYETSIDQDPRPVSLVITDRALEEKIRKLLRTTAFVPIGKADAIPAGGEFVTWTFVLAVKGVPSVFKVVGSHLVMSDGSVYQCNDGSKFYDRLVNSLADHKLIPRPRVPEIAPAPPPAK